MLLRRVVAAVAVTALAALAGCDDGGRPASVGNADVTSSTAASTSPFPTYVALGDSYTAAPGVPRTEQRTGCFRSSGNYPALVARRLGSTVVDVSCPGATTLDLSGKQRSGGRAQPPQFAALTADTSLVTLGMGGNDLGLFTTLIRTCGKLSLDDPGGSPCRDVMRSGAGGDLLVEKVARIGTRVSASLQAIHRGSPNARVVLVGYPQPVPAKGTCPILPLAAGDYPYVRSIVADLNEALRKAADGEDATYVDVQKASAGHDICAGPDAWVNGNTTDLTRAIAFHPFAAEQQAVADLVVARLEGS
jgi:lysophospholipase L1-like esterase